MQENKYAALYETVSNNKKEFDRLVKIVGDEKTDFETRLQTAVLALKVAAYASTGYFYCNQLESFFIDMAQKNETPICEIAFKPKTILHVMTRAYTSGGHTRVVERWLQFLAPLYKGSVVLLGQKDGTIPEALTKNARACGGDVIRLDGDDLLQKALELRRLAMEYQYVVLHTHMDDPTATVAFGTNQFKRPVFLFNHADFLFWIGKYVSDEVLEYRLKKCTSKEYRNIMDSKKCTIPAEKIEGVSTLNKAEARASKGFKPDDLVLFTSGTAFKYNPVCSDGIFDVLEALLNQDKKIKLIAMGVSKKNKHWKQLISHFPKRVTCLKSAPFGEYKSWQACADAVLDSYPLGGGTALIDAIKNGIPYVSLDDTLGRTDEVVDSMGFCATKEELILKTLKVLNDKQYAKSVLQDEIKHVEENASVEDWIKQVQHIFDEAPAVHQVKEVPSTNAPNFINDYTAFLTQLYGINGEPKNIINLFFIKLYTQKMLYDKEVVLKIFGKKFVLSRKKNKHLFS